MLAKTFVNLKSEISSIIPKLAEIKDLEVLKLVQSVSSQDLQLDVKQSNYMLAEKCEDKAGTSHAATAVVGSRGGQICFDLNEIVNQKMTKGELIGLAVHEHFHQLGLEDSPAMYRLISETAKLVQTKVDKVREEVKAVISGYVPRGVKIAENQEIVNKYIASDFLGSFHIDLRKKFGKCAVGNWYGRTVLELTRDLMKSCYNTDVTLVEVESSK